LVDADRPRAVRVVDVEALGGAVVGREGDREQAALAAVADPAAQVEEGAGAAAAAQGDDPARLLDDEEEAGEAGRAGDVDGLAEAADALQRQAAGAGAP